MGLLAISAGALLQLDFWRARSDLWGHVWRRLAGWLGAGDCRGGFQFPGRRPTACTVDFRALGLWAISAGALLQFDFWRARSGLGRHVWRRLAGWLAAGDCRGRGLVFRPGRVCPTVAAAILVRAAGGPPGGDRRVAVRKGPAPRLPLPRGRATGTGVASGGRPLGWSRRGCPVGAAPFCTATGTRPRSPGWYPRTKRIAYTVNTAGD